MRKYEADVSAPILASPAEYLQLPETEAYLPALQKFYERFGQPEPTPDCIDFPVLESLKMTRALRRSILLLRSNGAGFQKSEYRLYAFHFRSTQSAPAGDAEEYRFRGGEFSLNKTAASYTPVYKHTLAFRRLAGNALADMPDSHLDLSSDPYVPGRWIDGDEERLLDDIRTLDIPIAAEKTASASIGQLALVRTHGDQTTIAS